MSNALSANPSKDFIHGHSLLASVPCSFPPIDTLILDSRSPMTMHPPVGGSHIHTCINYHPLHQALIHEPNIPPKGSNMSMQRRTVCGKVLRVFECFGASIQTP